MIYVVNVKKEYAELKGLNELKSHNNKNQNNNKNIKNLLKNVQNSSIKVADTMSQRFL